jgi:hypothetical protein
VELGECGFEVVSGSVGVGAETLDSAGADAREFADAVGEDIIGLGATGVDGEVETHEALLLGTPEGREGCG